MKKLYFYVLLLSLWASGGLSAQVSVELIGKISIVPPQVAFTVSWTKAPYNNKIWVLAQYAKVSASGMGAEARAIITEVSATGATASTVTGNRGFWLEADGNNGSATVTATLSLADGVENFNWCVYAFDYPPNAVLQSDGTYQLRGSPPFTVNGDKLADGVKNFGAGTCITSITDATDNPEGIVLAVAWYSGGETSQTITVGDAITPITFETTCTTCITSVTSSGLPYGVSGTWTSPNYTVSGIPLLTGTYNYTLTAEDGNACSNASVYGTIKVEALPGTNQNQGGCTFMQPAVVSTFALFPANYYSASTFVTLTDERDRNNYTVVKIGSKWVMAQNLNYQTGLTWQTDSNLPTQESGGAVNALIGHFWCPTIVGPLTSTRASCDVWGALYTWETTMMRDGKYAGSSGTDTAWPGDGAYCSGNGCTNNMNQGGRGICPPNWHVPTDAEWGDVFDAMETGTKDHNTGMTGTRGTNAGSRAKAACTCESSMSPCPTDAVAMWSYYASNTGTDNYGLRLLPAGHRGLGGGGFASFGDLLDLVSASAVTASLTMARRVSYNSAAVERRTVNRSGGQPARCISD